MTQPEITGFRIALDNFEGPLDLLLQLIQSRKMDVTEVALSEVTDEFVAYTRQVSDRMRPRDFCSSPPRSWS